MDIKKNIKKDKKEKELIDLLNNLNISKKTKSKKISHSKSFNALKKKKKSLKDRCIFSREW